MWVVTPDYSGDARDLAVIHIDSIFRAVASLLSGKVRNTERGAVAGELGRQLCSDSGGVQKGRAGEVERAPGS